MLTEDKDLVPDRLNEVPTAFMGLTQGEMVSLGFKCLGGSCGVSIFLGMMTGSVLFFSLLMGAGVIMGSILLVLIAKVVAGKKAGTPYGYKEQRAKAYGLLAKMGYKRAKGIHKTQLWCHKNY